MISSWYPHWSPSNPFKSHYIFKFVYIYIYSQEIPFNSYSNAINSHCILNQFHEIPGKSLAHSHSAPPGALPLRFSTSLGWRAWDLSDHWHWRRPCRRGWWNLGVLVSLMGLLWIGQRNPNHQLIDGKHPKLLIGFQHVSTILLVVFRISLAHPQYQRGFVEDSTINNGDYDGEMGMEPSTNISWDILGLKMRVSNGI